MVWLNRWNRIQYFYEAILTDFLYGHSWDEEVSTKNFSLIMHYYEYHKKSEDPLIQAQEKYAWLFELWLSDESIEVRYYLLEYLSLEYWYTWTLEKDENGRPIPIIWEMHQIFWSISHSENYVAFIVSDKLTGIDIAEYKERDDSLLDIHWDQDYEIFWGKNWNNFYILWTAKESIIKVSGWWLEDVKRISLIDMESNNISTFVFHGKTFKIQTLFLDTVIISQII